MVIRSIILCIGLLITPAALHAQMDYEKLVDSLKFVTDMPYICHDGIDEDSAASGCGSKIFWKVVKSRDSVIAALINKLDDTTLPEASVPYLDYDYRVADVAYTALTEIVFNIPTFELLGVPFDENGCGYCSYWQHLNKSYSNRIKFKKAVKKWYDANRAKLVWVKSNNFSSCDCGGPHPNGGHYELKE